MELKEFNVENEMKFTIIVSLAQQFYLMILVYGLELDFDTNLTISEW